MGTARSAPLPTLRNHSDNTRVGGNVTVTTVPSPRALRMARVARLDSTIALVSGSPRPVPSRSASVVVDLLERLQRLFDLVLAHALPVSRTRRTASPEFS